MEQSDKYDVIIILGGGRDNKGNLTELSTQRLDERVEVYMKVEADKIFAMGGYFSTYSPKAIKFKITGAQLRKDYLIRKGVPDKEIILVENGRDTIGEAFASRKKVKELGFKKLIIVTSDKHIKRALWIFKRVYAYEFEIEGRSVESGDLLNENEEKENLELVKEFFKTLPLIIPDPDLETWFNNHRKFYEDNKKIHDKYHPYGAESQAYMGIEED